MLHISIISINPSSCKNLSVEAKSYEELQLSHKKIIKIKLSQCTVLYKCTKNIFIHMAVLKNPIPELKIIKIIDMT